MICELNSLQSRHTNKIRDVKIEGLKTPQKAHQDFRDFIDLKLYSMVELMKQKPDIQAFIMLYEKNIHVFDK